MREGNEATNSKGFEEQETSRAGQERTKGEERRRSEEEEAFPAEVVMLVR
jgi:hypothetical protein